MKKAILLIAIVTFLSVNIGNMAIAGDGPAPNSGDGISDGSGLDKGGVKDEKGAPNSGDGVSDGSGFETIGDLADEGDPCSDAGISGYFGY